MFGVCCWRFGVPLMDLGTIRLPRLKRIGLANRLVDPGRTLGESLALAQQLARLPQAALQATVNEFRLDIATIGTGETRMVRAASRRGPADMEKSPRRPDPARIVLHECHMPP